MRRVAAPTAHTCWQTMAAVWVVTTWPHLAETLNLDPVILAGALGGVAAGAKALLLALRDGRITGDEAAGIVRAVRRGVADGKRPRRIPKKFLNGPDG